MPALPILSPPIVPCREPTDFRTVGRARSPTTRPSPFQNEDLVPLHVLFHDAPSPMGQNNLDVYFVGVAEPEVRGCLLPRAVAESDTDLARIKKGRRLARPACRVNIDARSNAHPV